MKTKQITSFFRGLVVMTPVFLAPSVIAASWTNALGIAFAEVPAGTFAMGRAAGDANGRFWDELPIRQVTISQPFLLARAEVTNAVFEQFQATHVRDANPATDGNDEPVADVSWADAQAFIGWLNTNYPPPQPGLHYRLPTEAEWESAAIQAAALGLNAMTGSGVEEWAADWYGPYPVTAQTDPTGPASGIFRASRGGSYDTASWNADYKNAKVRMGNLTDARNRVMGFRLALGPALTPNPSPAAPPPAISTNVRSAAYDWAANQVPAAPFFDDPVSYVKLPQPLTGPYFSHNHVPAVAWCGNGDLLAIWYSTVSESGREMTVLGTRLRHGSTEWDPAEVFWDAPGRNDHTSGLWQESDGTLWHYNGTATDGHWEDLSIMLRKSHDHGVTWDTPRIIRPKNHARQAIIASIFQMDSGRIVVPCDAVPGGDGGTAILVSDDDGATWSDPGENRPTPEFTAGGSGAWIAGIHAGITETTRNGQRVLVALGRGDSISGKMPMSVSTDGGTNWTYSASPFPPIGGGQRPILRELASGALLLVSFTPGEPFTASDNSTFQGTGLFAALSYDGGLTWPTKKLMTDGVVRTLDGEGWTGLFQMTPRAAEPKGYLTGIQSPDGALNVFSSGVYYRLNQAWIETPPPLPDQALSDEEFHPAILFTVQDFLLEFGSPAGFSPPTWTGNSSIPPTSRAGRQ